MKKKGEANGDFEGWIRPNSKFSLRNASSCSCSFRFKGYTLQSSVDFALGATSLAGPRGIVSQEVLPTRDIFVRGGTPNRDCSPVKGTGGGCCANRCQVRADCWSSLLEAWDDIVDREWGSSEIGSGNSPSSKKSQSLQVSVDLLSIYERED